MKNKLKIKALILIIVLSLASGCIKVETGMKISLTKNVESFYFMGMMDAMMSQTGTTPKDAFKSDIRRLEDQGFKVTEHKEDGYSGIKSSKSLGNLDDLSYEGEIRSIDLDKADENTKYFKVERGFLKNTYTAKFSTTLNKTVLDELEKNGQLDNTPDEEEVVLEEVEVESLVEEVDEDDLDEPVSSEDGNNTTNVPSEDEEVDEGFDESVDEEIVDDDTMEQIKSMMKVNYRVMLPLKVISSNATKVSTDGKDLEWNLIDWKEGQSIEFKFEVWNITNVLILAGGALLILVTLIIMFVVSRKAKKQKAAATTKETPAPAPQNEKESALTPVAPTEPASALASAETTATPTGPVTLDVPKIEEVVKPPVSEVAQEEAAAPVTVEVPQIVSSPVVPVEPKVEEAKTE